MNPEAMKPHGLALLDYYHGDHSATVAVFRDDDQRSEIPAAAFFRMPQDIELELKALQLCLGRTLDVGAGAGVHALYLQQRGLRVCAIDVSPEAVSIMRDSGVIDARQIDVMSLEDEQFDSFLMMGHGIGIAETIGGLVRFLKYAHNLVRPEGQILLTSLDVRKTADPVNLEYHRRNIEAGRYFGEIRMHLEYGGIAGPQFGWLHIDPETLSRYASETGWDYRTVFQEEDGNYLARLSQYGDTSYSLDTM
jgi:SAM-dependent methyltransferase